MVSARQRFERHQPRVLAFEERRFRIGRNIRD